MQYCVLCIFAIYFLMGGDNLKIIFETKHFYLKRCLFIFLFPILFIYYEILFKILTAGELFNTGTVYNFLFSFAYGGVFYLIASISKNRKVNRIIALCLIAVTALPYLTEYFIYRQFKIFYDFNTVTGGAADTMSEFTSDIFSIVFRFNGLLAIFLYFLPFAIYLIFGKTIAPAVGSNAQVRILDSVSSVLLYLLSVLLIALNSVYAPIYSKEYNFQSAVSGFGLFTGLRLDIKNNLFKGKESFESESDISSEEESASKPSAKPVVYGYNKLDIDFTALAAKSSGRIAELHNYVSSQSPSHKNEYTGIFKGKNLIMITAEAFSAEVIRRDLTPTLYRLATKGINFTDYYQPASAGTTGGEYQNLLGLMPNAGGKSFKQTVGHNLYYSIGNQLNRLGYYGKAYHNNSYTYYDRHLTHNNLGYSDGFTGCGNGMEKYVTQRWPQSDLEMIAGTLPAYIDKQPFNIYYMSVSGHSGYSRTSNSMTKKNWNRTAALPYSDTVKGYFAANLELEDALTHLVTELEKKGIADNTVICISSDHFPYGLDDGGTLGNMPYLSELYGKNVTDRIYRDHSRLILWCGSLENKEPIIVDAPTFSLDILPTLSNLFGTEFDSRLLPGRDVFSDAQPLIFNMNYDWKTDLGTYNAATGKFTPNESAVIPDGYISGIKSVVRNKIKYCAGVLETDYYAKIFG